LLAVTTSWMEFPNFHRRMRVLCGVFRPFPALIESVGVLFVVMLMMCLAQEASHDRNGLRTFCETRSQPASRRWDLCPRMQYVKASAPCVISQILTRVCLRMTSYKRSHREISKTHGVYIPGRLPDFLSSRKQDACSGGSSVANVTQYCNEGYQGPREFRGLLLVACSIFRGRMS